MDYTLGKSALGYSIAISQVRDDGVLDHGSGMGEEKWLIYM